MPKLRRPEKRSTAGGVPVELLDVAHPVWATVKATARWLDVHDLTSKPSIYGPLNRHKDATRAWAISSGVMVSLPSGHSHEDWRTLREFGIPPHGGAAAAERFEHASVSVIEGKV